MTDTTTTEDSDLIAALLLQADKLLASERLLYGEAKASTAIVKVVDRFNQLLTDNAALKERAERATEAALRVSNHSMDMVNENAYLYAQIAMLTKELEQVEAHLRGYQDKYGFTHMAMDSAIQEFNAQAPPTEEA